MGAWGTEIFEDDTALDVRASYLSLLRSGVSDEEATKQTIEEYSYDAEDEEHKVIFWTALAASQWDVGRLADDVKERTLSTVAEGDSPLWREGEEYLQARGKVLSELRDRLNSQQPPRLTGADLEALCVSEMGEPDSDQGDDSCETQPPQLRKPWWQFWK